MEYTKEDLIEAKRQIDSTLHKLRETIITFEAKENPERYKSQITLEKTNRWRIFGNFFLSSLHGIILAVFKMPKIRAKTGNLFVIPCFRIFPFVYGDY